MSLLTIRQAIVDAIAAALPGVHVESHGGRFDSVEEIKRHAGRGRAVLVAITGLKNLEAGGDGISADLVVAAFVVTGDRPNAPRDAAALALIQSVAALVPGNRWGLEDAEGAPQPPEADNLYAASLDKVGVALWGLAWKQRFSLGNGLDPAGLDIFATFDARYAQGADGAPTAEDLVELPQED